MYPCLNLQPTFSSSPPTPPLRAYTEIVGARARAHLHGSTMGDGDASTELDLTNAHLANLGSVNIHEGLTVGGKGA